VYALNRRSFLKSAGAATAGTMLGARLHALAALQSEPTRTIGPNDHIQIALIGACWCRA
jgi:anaerobic selenocysteine-containing dehydrogenase